jgi:hypothetical protein
MHSLHILEDGFHVFFRSLICELTHPPTHTHIDIDIYTYTYCLFHTHTHTHTLSLSLSLSLSFTCTPTQPYSHAFSLPHIHTISLKVIHPFQQRSPTLQAAAVRLDGGKTNRASTANQSSRRRGEHRNYRSAHGKDRSPLSQKRVLAVLWPNKGLCILLRPLPASAASKDSWSSPMVSCRENEGERRFKREEEMRRRVRVRACWSM